jgi:rubrerythrin
MEGNMTTEQNKVLQALQIAIQMEIDGKAYYLQASQKSGNEVGKKLLRTLANEEDIHRQKFEEIYEAVRSERGWPVTDFKPGGGKRLRTIFSEATKEISSSIKPLAVQVAIGMESKTYDFYKSRGGEGISDAERSFYEAVAAEEREHHLVLLDYYEYLKDPAGWFVKKEHPSLDAG